MKLIDLLSKEEKICQTNTRIWNISRFKSLFVGLVWKWPLYCLVLVGDNQILELLVLLLGQVLGVFVINFHFSEFFNDFLRLFWLLPELLGHVWCCSGKSENICVEGGHVWLNVVEKEGLEQVRSVDFNVDFLEEAWDFESCLADVLLSQLIGEFNFV